MAWRTLGGTTVLLVVFISYVCHGSPLDRSEKIELEETLDKMNALLDKLAKTLDDDSLESDLPHSSEVGPNQSQENEPEPDEPQIGEGGYNWDLEQQQRSWDEDKTSLRSALRYLMQLQNERHAQQPAVKRDHDIPFPFLDPGHNGRGRWGNH